MNSVFLKLKSRDQQTELFMELVFQNYTELKNILVYITQATNYILSIVKQPH